ncbi:MAG: hypothetical protein E4H08_10020 [Candidatus Atribacteria bacterium]|nr:MAG: hypothetical protein E4H08_10020 [Candidatus Atribacteria bacterium]
MHKRLLLIGLLVVGVALLSGCELLDQILDAIAGGGTPDITYGEHSGGEVVNVDIGYWLMVTISEQSWPDAPITTYEGPIAAGFQPDTGTYNKATKTFTATSWDDETYSNTFLQMTLSDTEEDVAYFHVRQTNRNVFHPMYDWWYVEELRGYNIAHSHWSESRRSRFYEVVGVGEGTFDLLTYERWQDWEGTTWIDEWVNNSSHNILSDPANTVTIRVDYSEPQP